MTSITIDGTVLNMRDGDFFLLHTGRTSLVFQADENFATMEAAYEAAADAFESEAAGGNVNARLVSVNAATRAEVLLRDTTEPNQLIRLPQGALHLLIDALDAYRGQIEANPNFTPWTAYDTEADQDQLASHNGHQELIGLIKRAAYGVLDSPLAAGSKVVTVTPAQKSNMTSAYAGVLAARDEGSNDGEREALTEALEDAYILLGISEEEAEALNE